MGVDGIEELEEEERCCCCCGMGIAGMLSACCALVEYWYLPLLDALGDKARLSGRVEKRFVPGVEGRRSKDIMA